VTPRKIVSALVTAALLVGAVIVGGGVPLSPAAIARGTSLAADNVSEAVDNTRAAVQSTDALRRIADAVNDQVSASHRMLDIQLEIEDSSREGAKESGALENSVASIRRALQQFASDLTALSRLSERAGATTEAAAGSAGKLVDALDVLEAKFDVVVKESRKLDRKARGYRKLREGPR
jgi:methyl-accepting chemotaxis protein